MWLRSITVQWGSPEARGWGGVGWGDGSAKSRWSSEASKGLSRWRDSRIGDGSGGGFPLVATNDEWALVRSL